MRRTIPQLIAEVESMFADNNVGAITPAILRAFLKDFLATMRPAFGALHVEVPMVKTINTTPQIIAMQSVGVAVAPEWVANAFAGTLSRPAGDDGGVSYFYVNAELEGPNADDVSLEIFANGIPTGIGSRINAEGNGRPFGMNFTGLADSGGAAAQYDLRISLDSGSSSVVINQLSFIGQAIPNWA